MLEPWWRYVALWVSLSGLTVLVPILVSTGGVPEGLLDAGVYVGELQDSSVRNDFIGGTFRL